MTQAFPPITVDRLKAICPNARSDILEAIVSDAPKAFADAGLTDHVRVAHFIAQIATESAGLTRLDENLNYTTAARLRKVFPSKFKTDAAAKPYLKNPQKLANLVYGNKNGNNQPGDGWRYRGSGLIQLTGRENFRKVGKLVGMPLENEPDLARLADSALAIALGYWTKNAISTVAGEATDAAVKAVTKRINPALVGLAERTKYFKKAVKVLAPLPAAAAVPVKPAAAAAAAHGFAAAAAGAGEEELSGSFWVSRFPTSRAIKDLARPFATKVEEFVAAMKAGGAEVRISATYRPRERAYLMHWAWQIAKGKVAPGAVPPMPGVAIKWTHASEAKSRTAARQMVAAYGMVHVAALNSRHTERAAIDMTITWSGPLTIARKGGGVTTITTQPRNGGNSQLVAIGAGYGVFKLVTDPPHWSDDGR